ncbi:chemokine-like factor [Acipenser oxyrinchus oxyrinchus]|uniref:Chemokine-like factor n=1 Tax=Acipenser oxyrinchus oxyrinchus TaxID=40147 RepID=A0AAD8G5C1_ACIOX|nr:chemokine-like factor [Acipenser oxyrinchus oxyrinchus]
MEIDKAFLKSVKGALKIAEMVTNFIAFICFVTVSGTASYVAATWMEIVISFLFFLLYLLKLNKKLTVFFWPLIDIFNSVFAAVFMFIISIIAVSTYTVKGTLVGGIIGLIATGIWCMDAYLLFKKVTFNKPRSSDSAAGVS